MSINARRIALQGLGGGPLALALQGFLPVAQPVVESGERIGGGGVVSSATISLSDWLRLIERRAAEALAAETVLPAAHAPADRAAATNTARKRRRREEELLLLIG